LAYNAFNPIGYASPLAYNHFNNGYGISPLAYNAPVVQPNLPYFRNPYIRSLPYPLY
jgi:hypothetical protein